MTYFEDWSKDLIYSWWREVGVIGHMWVIVSVSSVTTYNLEDSPRHVNLPEDYGQTRGGCSFSWMVDVTSLLRMYVRYEACSSRNVELPMGSISTTTNNHPSIPILRK